MALGRRGVSCWNELTSPVFRGEKVVWSVIHKTTHTYQQHMGFALTPYLVNLPLRQIGRLCVCVCVVRIWSISKSVIYFHCKGDRQVHPHSTHPEQRRIPSLFIAAEILDPNGLSCKKSIFINADGHFKMSINSTSFCFSFCLPQRYSYFLPTLLPILDESVFSPVSNFQFVC